MKVLRAIAGIPVLLIAIVLQAVAFITLLIILEAAVILILVFLGASMGVALTLFCCLLVISLLELIPDIVNKKPIWACQKGKACIDGIFGSWINLIDCLKSSDNKLDRLADGFLDILMGRPEDLSRSLNRFFGTGDAIGNIIKRLNAICRGEYAKTD